MMLIRSIAHKPSMRKTARRQGERGQALIEFALFFVFMMLLLVGVTDIATLVDAHLNVVLAARTGARTGAVLGQGVAAVLPSNPGIDPDCAIVGAVHAALDNNSDVKILQISIFQAEADGTSTGYADVYNGTTKCNNSEVWSNGGPSAGSKGFWQGPAGASSAPLYTGRNINPLVEDSIGVAVTYQFTWRFNLWGSGTLQLTDQSVFPLNVSGEPTPIPAP